MFLKMPKEAYKNLKRLIKSYKEKIFTTKLILL